MMPHPSYSPAPRSIHRASRAAHSRPRQCLVRGCAAPSRRGLSFTPRRRRLLPLRFGIGRRGQLQALEPILIVIVLVIIAGIGLLFFVRINGSQGEKDRTVVQSQEDLKTLSLIARMPEFSCPRHVPASPCIDRYKAEAFAQLLQDEERRAYYFLIFGASNITITYYDLDTEDAHDLLVYDNLDRNITRQTTTYFTVYDPITAELKFARLTVRRER